MIRQLIFFLLLIVIACPQALAGGEALLLHMANEGGFATTRLVLDFSSLPACRVHSSGQRVDLVLHGAAATPGLRHLPEDETVVKTLLARKGEDLIVSFLLRRPPSSASATTLKTTSQIVLELFWEETAKPAIAFRIAGLPSPRSDGATATIHRTSPFAGQWEKFFDQYRRPVLIDAPLRFSLPPSADVEGEEEESEQDGGIGRVVAEGEALLREGLWERALTVLPPSLSEGSLQGPGVRIAYLRSYALAAGGDHYLARRHLAPFLETMSHPDPLRPWCRILQAEIALGSGDFKEALSVLKEAGAPWPEAASPVHELRLADALAGSGKMRDALKVYRRRKTFLAGHPLSLRNAAAASEEEGDFSTAASLYEKLAVQLADPEEAALARFASARARYLDGDKDAAMLLLEPIGEGAAGTEARYRARLLILDHKVRGGGEKERLAGIVGYGTIAEQAPSRQSREEAAFKQALTLFLNGEKERSVLSLQEFLRGFRSGALSREAEALLTEQLPEVIMDLIGRGEDLRAVVLVEQNRERLINGGVGWEFLHDLAEVFTRLGLSERACKIYLFMLDGSRGRTKEEGLYLPLVQLLFEREEYPLLEKYARLYLHRFPKGEDRAGIYLELVRALRQSGRLEEAADLLSASRRPWNPDLELLAAEVFWALGRFDQVADVLDGLERKAGTLPAEGLILQAESHFRAGRSGQALPIFRHLLNERAFADQSAYRCAQIEMDEGRKDEALKLLHRLAEKGESPLWRRMAEETVEEISIQ